MSAVVRRMRWLVAAALLAAPLAAVPVRAAGPDSGTFHESFASPRWWTRWGMAAPPIDATVESGADRPFLRVEFSGGTHGDTSFMLPLGRADRARLHYLIRFSPGWSQTDGGKLPGFGSPVLDSRGHCRYACGLAPADGVHGYSARASMIPGVAPPLLDLGSYVYDADMPRHGRHAGRFHPWRQQAVVPGEWYSVDEYIQMNTPRLHNGVIRACVGGATLAPPYVWSHARFRDVSTLHVGKVWMAFYVGGASPAPHDQYIDITDVRVEWGARTRPVC